MNVKEWKESTTKEITLESGLVLRVRRLSPMALAKIGPLPQMEDIPPEKNLEVAETIIRAGVISPGYGYEEGQFTCEDLTLAEMNEITEAIMDITRRPSGSPLVQSESSEAPMPS